MNLNCQETNSPYFLQKGKSGTICNAFLTEINTHSVQIDPHGMLSTHSKQLTLPKMKHVPRDFGMRLEMQHFAQTVDKFEGLFGWQWHFEHYQKRYSKGNVFTYSFDINNDGLNEFLVMIATSIEQQKGAVYSSFVIDGQNNLNIPWYQGSKISSIVGYPITLENRTYLFRYGINDEIYIDKLGIAALGNAPLSINKEFCLFSPN